jgi:FKBP-type peptidyl-prolyl cis-trans isomerase (trigger factor)
LSTDWQPCDPKEVGVEIKPLSHVEKQIVIELPAPIVEKILAVNSAQGEHAMSEDQLLKKLLQFSHEHGMQQLDWRPLWDVAPTSGVDIPSLQQGEPLRLALDVDCHPEMNWPDFKSLKVMRPVRVITDEMVAAEVLEQRLVAGTSEELESGFEVGDIIRAEVELFEVQRQSKLAAFNIEFKLPKSEMPFSLANLNFGDVHARLKDAAVGDQVELVTTATAQYPEMMLVGQEIRANLKILGAVRRTPTTIEKVLEQYGTPNEVVFKQQVKIALEATAERDQRSIVMQLFMKALLEQVKDQLHFPDRVVTYFEQLTFNQESMKLKARGFTEDEAKEQLAAHQEALDSLVELRLRQSALTTLLALHLDARIGEQDVMEWVTDTASRQGKRPEDVRKELANPDLLKRIIQSLQVMKVYKILMGENMIVLTDIDADEWDRSGGIHGIQ